MFLFRYLFSLCVAILVVNAANECSGQAVSAVFAGPTAPSLNHQVTYNPVFKDLQGNILPVEQVGVVDSWFSYSVTEDGPGPILSQSGIYLSVIWKTMGMSELECSIVTWDNYLECPTYQVFVQDDIPIPVITASANSVIQAGASVTLSVANYSYETYQWLKADGTVLTGETASSFVTTQPGVYKVRTTKSALSYTSLVQTVSSISELLNTNYVITNELKFPGVTNLSLFTGLGSSLEADKTIVYYDGLGRVSQTIRKNAQFNDVIEAVEYDERGRKNKTYLPYVEGDDGVFKVHAIKDPNISDIDELSNYKLSNHFKFYQTDPNITKDTYPFSEVISENSPLSRPIKEFGPGERWRNNEKGKAYKYKTNVDGTSAGEEKIIVWIMDANGVPIRNTDPELNVGSGFYPTGALSIKSTTDEQGNEIREYYKIGGKLILKKVQIAYGASVPANNLEWLQTYYVYDDFDDLRVILQPKLVATLAAGAANPTAAELNELAFQYRYDDRHRTIEKKVPGADWVYHVYDKRDRTIFVQDGNMRANNRNWWLSTLYDALNRPVITGMLTNSTLNRAQLQTYAYSLSNVDVSVSFATLTTPIMVNTNPIPSGGAFEPLQFFFFDNYDFTTRTYEPSNNGKLATGGNVYATPLPGERSEKTNGLSTGSKTRILEDGDNFTTGGWMENVNFYDEKGLLIQNQTENNANGLDVVTNRYDFQGKLVSTYEVHHNPSASVPSFTVLTTRLYDQVGNLLKISKKLNDDESSARVISKYEYNALGQLSNKQIGQKLDENGAPIANNFLESQHYEFNIRGWLTSVNKDYVIDQNNTHHFGMTLNYEQNAFQSFYNGNIAGMLWRSTGDNALRTYEYGYDASNRILRADFFDNNGYNFNLKMGDGSDPATAYDLNGNILRKQEWGQKASGAVQIDDQQYSYFTNSNKLKAVTEQGGGIGDNNLGDFTDRNTSDIDYGYDKNANTITDLNRQIKGLTGDDLPNGGGITYNFMNLATDIYIRNNDGSVKGEIRYTYDASGNKLNKKVIDYSIVGKSITTTTSYVHGVVYESKTTLPANSPDDDYSNKLLLIAHEEGRFRFVTEPNAPNPFGFDYFIKDHLGNVRLILTDELQKDAYATLLYEGDQSSIDRQNLHWDNLSGASIEVNTVRNEWPSSFRNKYGDNSANGMYGQIVKKSTANTGAAKLLKVMAGDKIHTMVDYYYEIGSYDNSNANGKNTFISSLLNALVNTNVASGIVKGEAGQLVSSLSDNSDIIAFFSSHNAGGSNEVKPKAYLNVLFFDELFKFDKDRSRSIPVSAASGDKGTINLAFEDALPVVKNGYVCLYVSNETEAAVFFDNFMLTHERGALVQETHYYPWGEVMAAISSKAAGGIENRFKYNGKELQSKELSDNSGLDLYDYGARMYDAQIGRFNSIDAHSDRYSFFSPYTYVFNHPVNATDPTGMDTHLEGEAAQEAFRAYQKNAEDGNKMTSQYIDNIFQAAKDVVGGGESDENFTIKAVLPIYQSIMPTIYNHIWSAINEEGYSSILSKGVPMLSTFRRNVATRFWRNSKRPFGFSVDEYPFASSAEGGYYNGRFASTILVPVWEQGLQSEQMSVFMAFLNVGDRFLVEPVSSKLYPSPVGVAYHTVDPSGKRTPSSYIFPKKVWNSYFPAPRNEPGLAPAASALVLEAMIQLFLQGIKLAL